MAIPIAFRWGQFPTIAAILDGDSAVSNGSIGHLSFKRSAISFQPSAFSRQLSAVSIQLSASRPYRIATIP